MVGRIPRISVLVAVFEAADHLPGCLQWPNGAKPRGADIEILVLDGGTTGADREVVERFTGNLPELRYLFGGVGPLHSLEPRREHCPWGVT